MSKDLWEQYHKHACSPRRQAQMWVPRDELTDRENLLWWEDPHHCVEEDGTPVRKEDVAKWPAQRRQLLHESHEDVMESLSRYGKLP